MPFSSTLNDDVAACIAPIVTGSPGYLRISKHAYPGYTRGDLFKNFEPFRANAKIQTDKSGYVTAGVCKAIHKAAVDRIHYLRKYNRYCCCLLF